MGGVVAHVIIVSPSPIGLAIFYFFGFGIGTGFRGTDLGLGLDKNRFLQQKNLSFGIRKKPNFVAVLLGNKINNNLETSDDLI